ncbi:TPA: hypothetical protein ACH3X2_001286 [Trebouxia sp. C0005]
MVQLDPIATVDLTDFQARKPEITKQLMAAASDIGFFRVKGHGMSLDDINAAHAMSLKFLDLSDEVKGSLPMNKENFAYILGWSDENLTAGRLREGMMIGYDNERMKNLWPTKDMVPEYKQHMISFMLKCHAVTEQIMSCFALGLGLQESVFKEAMDPHAADCQTAMYCNRYPSVEGKHFPEGALRIGAHTDFELLTLLFTRPGEVGLEVCAGKGTTAKEAMKTGLWQACDPVAGAITINIGDALQYWSDDRLKSTFHRVRVPKEHEYKGERHSMAYFANVRATAVLQGPLNKYPPITFPQILATKAKKRKELNLKPRDQMTDQEKLARWKEAHGPDFVMADVAVTPQPPALGDTSALDQPAPATHDATATPNGGMIVTNGSETNVMQGDRHSMAYFANARGSTLLQGPNKKYPPITFPEILAEKRRQMDEMIFGKT